MAQSSQKTILITDDEPDVRNFLATVVKDAGFQVKTAVDGADALDQIAQSLPDLMILDMVMPRKSGIQVIRTLRANPEWAKLPVIVVTAHARDEFGSDDIKEFNAFASGLRPRRTMEKPITPTRLVQTICEILEVEPEPATVGSMGAASAENDLINLIQQGDPDTLAKIRAALGDN